MSDVDPKLACRLLKASRCAYRITKAGPLNSTDQDLADVGFTQPPLAFVAGQKHIDACYVGETGDSVILAFRGTLPPNVNDGIDAFQTSLLDWLNDADAELVTAPDSIRGNVHKGFRDALDFLWKDILATLNKVHPKEDSRKFYVTGHSKGGAVAYLAAMRAAKAGIKPDGVYTYAAARCGSGDFASDCQNELDDLWRFEYQNDLVPHLPPSFDLLSVVAQALPRLQGLVTTGYESVGALEFIDWDNRIIGDSFRLPLVRQEKLAQCLLQGENGLKEIVKAHSLDPGGGYSSVICGS